MRCKNKEIENWKSFLKLRTIPVENQAELDMPAAVGIGPVLKVQFVPASFAKSLPHLCYNLWAALVPLLV